MAAPASCMPSATPPPLPQLANQSYAIATVPNSTAPNPALAKCCAPNNVSIDAGCFEYCVLPPAYANDTDEFQNCLSLNGWFNVTNTSSGPPGQVVVHPGIGANNHSNQSSGQPGLMADGGGLSVFSIVACGLLVLGLQGTLY